MIPNAVLDVQLADRVLAIIGNVMTVVALEHLMYLIDFLLVSPDLLSECSMPSIEGIFIDFHDGLF